MFAYPGDLSWETAYLEGLRESLNSIPIQLIFKKIGEREIISSTFKFQNYILSHSKDFHYLYLVDRS